MRGDAARAAPRARAGSRRAAFLRAPERRQSTVSAARILSGSGTRAVCDLLAAALRLAARFLIEPCGCRARRRSPPMPSSRAAENIGQPGRDPRALRRRKQGEHRARSSDTVRSAPSRSALVDGGGPVAISRTPKRRSAWTSSPRPGTETTMSQFGPGASRRPRHCPTPKRSRRERGRSHQQSIRSDGVRRGARRPPQKLRPSPSRADEDAGIQRQIAHADQVRRESRRPCTARTDRPRERPDGRGRGPSRPARARARGCFLPLPGAPVTPDDLRPPQVLG